MKHGGARRVGQGSSGAATAGVDSRHVPGALRHLAVATLALFVAIPLAGCLGGDDGLDTGETDENLDGRRTVTVINDPTEDATEWNAGLVKYHGGRCPLLGPVDEACREATDPVLDEVPQEGGVPAHPSLDIRAMHITETPTSVIAELEVASLQADFSGVVQDDTDPAYWLVGWSQGEPGNQRWVEATVTIARPSGVLKPNAILFVSEESCSYVQICAWVPDVDIEPGTPGVVRFEMPRGVLPDPEPGTVLDSFYAGTARGSWAFDRGVGWGVGDPSLGLIGGDDDFRRWYRSDIAEGTENLVLQTPYDPDLQSRSSDHKILPEGDLRADPDRTDLDMLRVEFRETPTHIAVATKLARVDETRTDPVGGWAAIATTAGPLLNAGYDWDGEQLHFHAGACAEPGCTWGQDPIEVEITFEPGAPGWVVYNFSREALGHPMPGDWITYAASWTHTWESTDSIVGGNLPVNAWRTISGDWAQMMPFYMVQEDSVPGPALDEEGEIEPQGARLDTQPGTAELPPLARITGTSPARYDITYLESRPTDERSLLVTLGLEEFDQVIVPTGYRGVLYAVGLETEDGQAMVGYYKGEGQLGNVGFFCAADSVVFTEDPLDPNDVPWHPITGMSSGGSGGGALTFIVPLSPCLSADVTDQVDVDRWGAATYLVGGEAQGEAMERVDHAVSDERWSLDFSKNTQPPVHVTAWYTAPFGVSAFWDIAGIAFAALLALGGAFLWHRRRSLLRKYLAELQRVASVHAKRPRAQEEVLLDIRERAKKDFDRDRLRDEHFVILEHRIETQLSKARIAGLEDVFGDLPHRLMENLKEMLADGVLSPRDYRTLSALLDDSPLEKGAKTALREKLAKWLEQDAGSEVPEHPLVRP